MKTDAQSMYLRRIYLASQYFTLRSDRAKYSQHFLASIILVNNKENLILLTIIVNLVKVGRKE